MSSEVASTRARVKKGHAEMVRKIIDSFKLRGVEVMLSQRDGGWIVHWSTNETNDDDSDAPPGWFISPQAVPRTSLPKRGKFPNEQDWEDAIDGVYLEKGDEGLRDMLGQIGTHLDTLMTIVAVTMLTDDCLDRSTQVFIVQPGQSNVEVLWA